MALARLAVKNLQQRLASTSSSLLSQSVSERALHSVQKGRWGSELLRNLSSAAGEEKSEGEKSEARDVAVSEGGEKSKLFPRRQRGGSLWKRTTYDFPPLWEFFPSGLGDARVQASVNISRLMENLEPSQLIGRVKEKDDCYKLRFNLSGLGKDDMKIIVEDGVLTIKGERREEAEEGSDDEDWSAGSYRSYDAIMLLPDDAKVDEIKAEMRNGVLTVLIPRIEKPKNDAKEIRVH